MNLHSQLLTTLREAFTHDPRSIPHPQNLWDCVYQFGNEIDALLYAQLFCPDFTQVEDSVLINRIGGDTATAFIAAKKTWKGSLSELEASFNLLEVAEAFSNTERATDTQAALLAEFIAESWRARLALLYPTRGFEVVVLPPAESGYVHEIRFSEVRPPA